MDGQQAYVLNRDLSVSVVDTRQGQLRPLRQCYGPETLAGDRSGTWQ